MNGPVSPVISLRAIKSADLPVLFENGCDPVANALAGSKPRTWEAFEPRWEELMRDQTATMRAILLDGELVGAINVLVMDGVDSIGYWIARPHWGRGIATHAIGLILKEVTKRPLYATAAAYNVASLKSLLRHGFVEVSRAQTPETERSVARETVTLVLK